MSGVEVIGAISGVIALIDACVKIWDNAAKDLKLPKAFPTVARQLPILVDTLNTCKTHLEPQKSSIPSEVWKALEETLESCEDKARDLRTIFEKVVASETDGWRKRYVKVVQRPGKGKKVEDLMKAITEDVQLVVNHRAVQSAQPEQRQQLEQIVQEVQSLESSLEDNGSAGMNFTNWNGTQNVNTGDGQQFNYENMTGTQNFNLVMRQKVDFQFTRPVGLYLDQAPYIDSSLFVGRASEILGMHQVLWSENGSQEQRRVVLGGVGGVGKTQLAIAYAKSRVNDYDSIIFVNAMTEAILKTSFKSIAERIFNVQDLENLTNDQVIAGIKRWLSDSKNTKWLLIFDNYDEPKAYDLELYYPRVSHGAVIITTRLPDEVGIETLMVRSLNNIEESLEILQTRSKRENLKSDIHARRLAERLAGLPLALVTAGAFLHRDKSTWTFERYLSEYEKRWNVDPRRRLRLHDYEGTLYTTWDMSYQRLENDDPDAAQMLKLLAYFGHESIWYELLRAGRRDDLPDWLQMATEDLFDFDALMRTLVEYCFLEVQSTTQAYGMHTCVHDWTLAGINSRVEEWSYWYAFDCVANSISFREMRYFGSLSFARYTPHAIRLTHIKFFNHTNDIKKYRIDGAENIALLLQAQFQLDAARMMLQCVLIWKEKVLGPDHRSVLATINSLASLCCDQDKLEEAEALYKRALAGMKKSIGADARSTLVVVDNLGNLYRGQGRLDEAEMMYQRALAGKEKSFGMNHTVTLLTLNNLGVLHTTQGRLDAAEILHQRALSGRETQLGRDHPLTLDSLNNLGCLYLKKAELKQAEAMFKRALAGKEAVLGRDHQSTLITVGKLGAVNMNQGQLDEAEAMFKRVLAVNRSVTFKDDLLTLDAIDDLGELYMKQGKLNNAEVMFNQVLARSEKVRGPNHKETLQTVYKLGSIYLKQDQLADAEKSFYRVLESHRGGDELKRWPKTITALAMTLSKRVRASDHDVQAENYHLARLVHNTDIWGRQHPTRLLHLVKALISVKNDDDAQIAFFHAIKLVNPAMDLAGVKCDACGGAIPLITGLHICRCCDSFDLCDACLAAYNHGTLTVPTCQGHEFFNASSGLSSLLNSPQLQNRTDANAWFSRLQEKYPLIAEQ